MSKTDSLYVSNLPYNTNDEDLAAAFDGCLKAKVIMDPNTQRSRGFGFVQFESAEAADAMIEKTNGEVEIDGRTCKVNHANPPRSDGERRGGGGGGFGGGGRGFGGRGRGGSGGGGGGRYSGNYSRDGGSSYGGRESSSGGYGGYKRNTGGSSGGSYTSTGYGYSSSGH